VRVRGVEGGQHTARLAAPQYCVPGAAADGQPSPHTSPSPFLQPRTRAGATYHHCCEPQQPAHTPRHLQLRAPGQSAPGPFHMIGTCPPTRDIQRTRWFSFGSGPCLLLGTCIKELHLPTWPAPPLTALAVWASTHTCTGGAHHTRAMGDDGTCQARRARPPGAPCICCCQPPTPTAHPGPPCENPGTRPHCQPRAADCTEPALGWSPHAQRPSAVPSHQPRHALPIQQGKGAITWGEARGRRARAASCRAAAGAWPAAALTTPHKSAGSLA
jgi:hypothetical protein